MNLTVISQARLYENIGTGEDSGLALARRLAAAGLGDDDVAHSTFVDVSEGTGTIVLSWPRVHTFHAVGIRVERSGRRATESFGSLHIGIRSKFCQNSEKTLRNSQKFSEILKIFGLLKFFVEKS